MTPEEIRASVLRNLGAIAPEVDLEEIDPACPLREQLDIDSMDALNFLIALHKEFAVDIPERDYGKLTTLNACVDYLQSALTSRRA